MLYLGIDIGGTTTKLAIVKNEQIIDKVSVLTNFKKVDIWKQAVLTSAQKLYQKYKFTKISLATAGVVDDQGQIIGANQSAQKYVGTNWKELFNTFFKFDIFAHSYNDAQALARYEQKKHHYQNALCLTLGTGVGLSLIINKQIYSGANFFAGQIGSVIALGNKSWDNTLSATRFKNKIEKILTKKITLQELKQYYQTNSEIQNLCHSYVKNLAQFIVFICALLDLPLVILGGGLSYSGDFFQKLVQKQVTYLMPPLWKKPPQIIYSQAKNEANILGLFI